MSILKNIRLGLLHIAVAITFVLINGVLNRVMIYNLNILASVVAVLVVLPYLLAPLQVWIGQYSDTHPIMGYRRTPHYWPRAVLNKSHSCYGLRASHTLEATQPKVSASIG